MKTAHAANERTPLLGNGASNVQTPLIGEETISNSDNAPLIISCPRMFEPETNEVSLEEVVQALLSAWRRHRVLKEKVALDFFTTKELYAMHVAWANVTRGRQCSSRPHILAEALADAIAVSLYPNVTHSDDSSVIYFTMTKFTIGANLLQEWTLITEEDEDWEFPVRYVESIFEETNEQPTAVSEFRLGRVELYDKAHDFILNPKLQVLLHTFLIIWPISILIIGSKYMECPMGHHLSYLLMILGCVGCLAILGRLGLMHLSSVSGYPYDWFWKWNSLRLLEFTFLVLYIVQAFHFFFIDPTTEPDPQTCVKNFYNAALVINYVSIPIVSAYAIAYLVITIAHFFDFWHWIFRNQ